MATDRKKEASIVSITMFLALVAVTPKLLVASFIPDPVLAQQGAPASFPMPTAVPSGTTVRIDGSSSMEKANQALKQRFEKQYAGTKVELNAQGSDAALKELVDGKIDLAAIGRPLTEQEKAQGLVQVPLSRQKIAIIVGPDNPYKGDITFDKFAGIFRGQITNWSQLGGPPGPIVLIDRPESSDTRRAFKSYQVFQTAPFKTGANAKQINQDSTIEVIKQLGKNGLGYAIADQVLDRKDVHIIRMHKVLPDNPRYPFSQTLTYVYKQSNPNPGIPLYLGFATDSSNQQTVKEAIANTTTAPAAPQPAPSKPAETAKVTEPGVSSSFIKGGGETATSEVGFPWWLLLLLGIPLLGGLVWWLLKSGRPQAGSPVDAIPPTDKRSTTPTVVPPAPRPPSSRLFLVPYEGKNAYAYWEIAPAQIETLQRGGGELMLRLYDVTGIPRSEQYSPYILQQFGCDAQKQYLLLTLPAENRDYMVELGYLTEAGGWIMLTRSETVRVAANIPTGNVIVLDSSRGNWPPAGIAHVATAPSHSRLFLVPYDRKNTYVYWEINPAQVEDLQRGGGEKLMLRLYDVTGPDSERHSPHILQQFGCEFQQQYLLLTLPAENRDYIAELGYLTQTGGWLLLARSATVRVAASIATDNVFVLEGSRGNGHAAPIAHAAGASSHSRLFLVPYDGKNTYAYWEIAPAQMEALQRGGGEQLMLRLYDVTDIPNPEHHTLHYLHEYDTDAQNRYLVITLPEENRDYIVELGYLTQAGNWVLLARSGTVRVAANASTGNVALFLVLRDSNNAYTYWEIPPSAISALKHPIVT